MRACCPCLEAPLSLDQRESLIKRASPQKYVPPPPEHVHFQHFQQPAAPAPMRAPSVDRQPRPILEPCAAPAVPSSPAAHAPSSSYLPTTPLGCAVVFDNGSASFKAGMAGDAEPLSAFPSAVGREKLRSSAGGSFVAGGGGGGKGGGGGADEEAGYGRYLRGVSVGGEAVRRQAVLRLSAPFVGGGFAPGLLGSSSGERRGSRGGALDLSGHHASCRGDVEALWAQGYAEVGAAPDEHPLLLTAPCVGTYGANPNGAAGAHAHGGAAGNRRRMVELAFEAFRAPAVHIIDQGVLALYAAGLTTGLALTLGAGVSVALPVVEGCAAPAGAAFGAPSGEELTAAMAAALSLSGRDGRAGGGGHDARTRAGQASEGDGGGMAGGGSGAALSTSERLLADSIKERLCAVRGLTGGGGGGDFSASGADVGATDFELPDGNIVRVEGETRLGVGERLFEAARDGSERATLPQMVHAAAGYCESGAEWGQRRQLLRSVVLAGGGSMLEGLPQRLLHELRAGAAAQAVGLPQPEWVEVVAPEGRALSAWAGGAVLASLPTFGSMWITEQEFAEHGAAIVDSKCMD